MGLIDLVREIISGQDARRAQDMLYRQLGAEALRLIEAYIPPRLRSRLDPDDVFNAAFIRAISHLSSFRGSTDPSFRAWFLRIARNLILDTGRRHSVGAVRITQNGEGSGVRESRVMGREPPPDAREPKKEQLMAFLRYLRPDDARLIRLRDIDGRTFEEIAEILGKTPEAVQRAHHRALDRVGVVKSRRLRLS
jgi:RNA polymerase sigma-70 factor, ECF subfamily